MNYFYIILIVFSMIGIFSQQKFMDIIFHIKILTTACIVHLWDENLISDSQAYVAFVILFSLYMLLIANKLPTHADQEEEIDRV